MIRDAAAGSLQSTEIARFGQRPAASSTDSRYFSGWGTSKSAFMYIPQIMKTSGQWLTQTSQPMQSRLLILTLTAGPGGMAAAPALRRRAAAALRSAESGRS